MMRIALPLLLALAAVGCSGGDGAPKDDGNPAPPVSYKMVPATTGGTGGGAPAPAAGGATASPSNPPSAGSD